MAKPGGERSVQGQGINIINPNKGPAVTTPYQSGGKNAPSAEQMRKGLKSQPEETHKILKGNPIPKTPMYAPMSKGIK